MQSNNTNLSTFYDKMVSQVRTPARLGGTRDAQGRRVAASSQWTVNIPCELDGKPATVTATFKTKQEADKAVRKHFGSDSTRWDLAFGDEEQAFAEYVDGIVQQTIGREREVLAAEKREQDAALDDAARRLEAHATTRHRLDEDMAVVVAAASAGEERQRVLQQRLDDAKARVATLEAEVYRWGATATATGEAATARVATLEGDLYQWTSTFPDLDADGAFHAYSAALKERDEVRFHCDFLEQELLSENRLCGLIIQRTGTSCADIKEWIKAHEGAPVEGFGCCCELGMPDGKPIALPPVVRPSHAPGVNALVITDPNGALHQST